MVHWFWPLKSLFIRSGDHEFCSCMHLALGWSYFQFCTMPSYLSTNTNCILWQHFRYTIELGVSCLVLNLFMQTRHWKYEIAIKISFSQDFEYEQRTKLLRHASNLSPIWLFTNICIVVWNLVRLFETLTILVRFDIWLYSDQ